MHEKNPLTHILTMIISAAMFLSRLPLQGLMAKLETKTARNDEGWSFARTAQYFGPAAIIVALPTLVVSVLTLLLDFSALVSAILIVSTSILTTGALHEDALADVADGFGGGKTPEQKLEIMRDSQIGTYGASVLIISILLQIAIYVELLAKLQEYQFLLLLVAANVASTTVMVWPWATEAPARKEGGLSTSHGVPTREIAINACLIGFSLAGFMLWFAVGVFGAVIALVICGSFMVLFTWVCRGQIGGHTGDSLGATKKISELGLLLALLVAT